MQKEAKQWTNIESDKVLFYPLFHKSPDLLSSNSYLFQFPECSVVIDPGGTTQHFNAIIELLEENNLEEDRPVFILITHCHFDHVRSLHIAPSEQIKPFFIGGHTSAVEKLRNADLEHTLSFLYTDHIPPIKLNFELFSSTKNNSPLELSNALGNKQLITLPSKSKIIAYHTPGHSSCSVCYQIGNILFIGDLLFAHNPIIAGTYGWSQPDLFRSLVFIKSIIDSEKIERVFGGHGLELAPDKTVKIIDSILGQLPELNNLVHLDLDRFNFLKECAITFMKEIEYQIIVQNGRLLRVAGELEKLGELDLARSIIDTSLHDKLDNYLESFHQFLSQNDADLLRSTIPMKGAQLIKMLQKMLTSMSVPPPLTLHYLNRLQTLFKSYLTIIRGIDFSIFAEPTSLTQIIRNCIVLFSQHTLPAHKLFELTESEENFAIYLAQRIDGQNRIVNIKYTPEKEQLCLANTEHLNSLIGDVIESLVSGVSRKTTITPINDEMLTGCRFMSNPVWEMSAQKVKFYHLFSSLLDGKFKQHDDGSFSFSFQKVQAQQAITQ
ncbi:MAG: MBL fold metallo-hydrolase [Prolixibacteraceae bacterium]|jgi:glyoxylase-like metal-dependent hydrolase (beta-lactamase superfamily II)|nr:MBL fold metallo-hydrolase [Prolixibacteraceae bacterium]